ncbi:hypothetical protein BH11PSE11_BH11PSE11_03030 [soil metagenome]
MKIRTALLSCLKELGAAGSNGVQLQALQAAMSLRQVTREDFAMEMNAALHEGDVASSSPGLLRVTDKGDVHFKQLITLA